MYEKTAELMQEELVATAEEEKEAVEMIAEAV
jgi:hypothetical protein